MKRERQSLPAMSVLASICLVLVSAILDAGTICQDELKEKQSIGSLTWLAGNWISETDAEVVEEHWMAPRGGLMLGLGRTVKTSGRRNFEYMRIEEKNGALTFYASPSGQPATPFKATSVAEDKVVFENPMNDFPTKITYWKDGEQLRARIEGEINGSAESMEWTWNRAK
jgi:hypothetical protein